MLHDVPDEVGDQQNFRYDGLRRLTRAWTANDTGECAKNATNAISSSPAPYEVAYTYDVLGNRTTATATGANGAVTTTSYTYSSTRPHQLLAASSTGAASATATFAYDAAGHQITRTTNGSKVDLTWDAEGELTSVGTDTSAVYDANGERLVRVDATGTTVYLPGGQELSINAGKVTATRYYTFAGQSVAVRTGRGLGAVTSLVADMHGTTLAAVPNGSWKKTSVIKQYTDPFGATRGTAVTVPGDRQFLDKTRDSTGLTLVGARYYDEHTGRFISLDPLLDLSDPQQWNGYAYANNNPTSLSDPTGLAVSVSIEDDGAKRPSTGPSQPTPTPSAGPAPTPPPATTSRAATAQGVSGVCDAAWVAAHQPKGRPWWQKALGYAGVGAVAALGTIACAGSLGLGCVALVAGATAVASFGNNYVIQGQSMRTAAKGALLDGALTFGTLGTGVAIGRLRNLPTLGTTATTTTGSLAAGGIAANTARSLPAPAEAEGLLRAAKPTGSALKSDAAHRAGDWVIDDVAQSGSVFELVGGDGVSRTLVQVPGEMNGVAGRFEWIMEGQDLTHQLFVRGGTINGIPIKP